MIDKQTAMKVSNAIANSLKETFAGQPAIEIYQPTSTGIVVNFRLNPDKLVDDVSVLIDTNQRGLGELTTQITGYSFSFGSQNTSEALRLAMFIQQATTVVFLAKSLFAELVNQPQ